ncbi:hypothetical protein F5Y03DRAFT_371307 [Xylaria venustula]|nr:hypothetical protein F5Y03DRAFT_371307 [Xylaria venustula]
MKELAKVLHGWQSEYGKSIASVLYSDIGKEYYSKLDWLTRPGNCHFVFPSVEMEQPALARLIPESELQSLCRRDEFMIRKGMATPSTIRKHMMILPDLDHMLWHIRKEDFAVNYIFGKKAEAKGAIAGNPGKKVWAIWVRRYYEHPNHSENEEEDGGNCLYILRLVVEGHDTANRPHDGQLPPATDAYVDQAIALKAVLQAALAEAAKWSLRHVQLWKPSLLVQSFIRQGDFDVTQVERQERSIASVLWFKEAGDGAEEAPAWVSNEHYAWCWGGPEQAPLPAFCFPSLYG